MIVNVPQFAEQLEDEGLLTLVAFCTRIAERYGYQETYTMHIDDVIRICNKRKDGVAAWIQSNPLVNEWLDVGHLYDDVLVFHWRRTPPKHKYGKASRNTQLIERELKDNRQQLIWAYILGCLNNNVLLDEDEDREWLRNTFGQKSFNFTRETIGYIKKSER